MISPALLRLTVLLWVVFMTGQAVMGQDGSSQNGSGQSLRDFKRVVVAADALAVQKTAAAELAAALEKMTGRQLPVVAEAKGEGLSFFVGDGAAKGALPEGELPKTWKTEEHILRTVPQGLVLAGHDAPGDAWSSLTPAGSMLAVYTLLEDHLGAHWFWPGESGAHLPKLAEDAALPVLDVRRVPQFEIRSVQLGYSSYHTPAFKAEARKWARRNRLGWVRPAVFGHSWFDAFNLRNDESFKAHPEWFALVKGVRRPPQMCTTNPEVIQRMVEHVLKGKAAIGNISPSDGGGFCECERCQALDVPGVLAYDGKTVQLSDRIFTYANEVARRVREADPSKGVGMFAYTFYNKPPVRIPKLEENLYLSFVYQSAAHRDPANLAEWRKSVDGWQKLGAKMVVREGWGNHYYHDLPFLHHGQILANLSEAGRMGFVAAYGEGSKSFATQATNYWAMTRMMQDPGRDIRAVMPEFYRTAYGPAAAEMQAWFDTYNQALDAGWAKRDRLVDTTGIAYANVIGAWGRLIPQAAVEAAERHLAAAEKAAAGSPEHAERVKLHRLGQDYTRVMTGLLELYRELAVAGVKLDTFSTVAKERRETSAGEKRALLERAFQLGEERENLLLAHRDLPGPDEGLYAFTNDGKLRQWHAAVKRELGEAKETRLRKAVLLGGGR